MKFLTLTLAFLLFATPVMAELTFPLVLQGREKAYAITIPIDEEWTIRNMEAENNMRLEFANIKLDLEGGLRSFEIQIANLNLNHELEIKKLDYINNTKMLYLEDKVVMLEDNLKRERRKGSFLGISTNYFSFVFGAAISAVIAAGIK